MLSARNLRFSYGDQNVLRDVSVELRGGEIVALLGPNGSGKSTLIRLLLGQLPVAAGEIAWDGRAIGGWRRRELARRVAYLPQSPTYDAEQTVLDVLRLGRAPYWSALGLESETDLATIEDVAGTMELADLLGRRMDELSGGQRQRVFVGRCLVQRPSALLLDEPSTFLDLRHQVEVAGLLRKLADGGLGVLMASHDLNLTAHYADRMVLLESGHVAAEGTPAQVLREELVSRVYGVKMARANAADASAPVLVPIIGPRGAT